MEYQADRRPILPAVQVVVGCDEGVGGIAEGRRLREKDVVGEDPSVRGRVVADRRPQLSQAG
jgi:hypothetical protein